MPSFGAKTDSDLMVIMEGIVQFSRSIPSNTFIDSCDVGQHLNFHTKHIGCSIDIDRISGSGRTFNIDFIAKWQNTEHLSVQLLKR